MKPTVRSDPARTTVVICDDWPVTALQLGGAGAAVAPVGAPVLVLHANRVVACSPAARQSGVEVGLRRREAQRRCPEVIVAERDRRMEARRFEVVASAMDDLTPRVEVETPGWCSFATRGPSRYFGGDEAMSLRLVELIDRCLEGATTVRVGTADTRFSALQAAFVAGPGEARVVAPGGTASFLAPLPVSALLRAEALQNPHHVARGGSRKSSGRRESELAELVHVLCRLGLTSLGDFGELSSADVVGRFGVTGQRAHRWATASDERLASWREPPDDLTVTIDLDPPVERVDQAAFIAKALADEFCSALAQRGLTCSRVAVGAQTEQGEVLIRLWRGEGSLSAAAVADRMRWQLDGWLAGSRVPRVSGGLTRLWLQPDQVMAATGQQLGLWGAPTQNTARAVRSVARVQGLLGEGSVTVAEVAGGRTVREQVIGIGVEAVDLTERSIAGVPGAAEATGARGDGTANVGREAHFRWLGRIPEPFPSVVYPTGRPARVVDGEGKALRISARGVITGAPVTVQIGDQEPQLVTGWAGPWLLDERWWDDRRSVRRAYLQVCTSQHAPYLLFCAKSQWICEAVYS